MLDPSDSTEASCSSLLPLDRLAPSETATATFALG